MSSTDSAATVRIPKETPWGSRDYFTRLNPQGTVVEVGTASHGGIGVHSSIELPAHILPQAMVTQGDTINETWRWFEEDLAWALVAIALPDLFESASLTMARDTVINWFPEIYEQHYGTKPTAAESMKVRERVLNEQLAGVYRPRTAFGDWAWNVPKGHVYVLGHRASDNSTEGFLVPDAEYRNLDTLVLDSYPKWCPDKTLPYSKR